MSNLKVSTCIITYNHEDYIEDCIKGALAQKISKHEIVIGDDCSADKTSQICQKYQSKYPDIIKYYRRKKNLGMIGNWIKTIKQCKGKYIALCEGDDYWTDPIKLQKQVDFLEANEEYGLAHGNCDFLYQKTQKTVKSVDIYQKDIDDLDKKNIFYELLHSRYKIRTATVLFKKELLDTLKSNDLQFKMGDTVLWLNFSQKTKFKFFKDTFSVYRLTPNTASRPKNRALASRFQLSMYEMRIYMCDKFNYEIPPEIIRKYNKAFISYTIWNRKYKSMFGLINPSLSDRLKLYFKTNILISFVLRLYIENKFKLKKLLFK